MIPKQILHWSTVLEHSVKQKVACSTRKAAVANSPNTCAYLSTQHRDICSVNFRTVFARSRTYAMRCSGCSLIKGRKECPHPLCRFHPLNAIPPFTHTHSLAPCTNFPLTLPYTSSLSSPSAFSHTMPPKKSKSKSEAVDPPNPPRRRGR